MTKNTDRIEQVENSQHQAKKKQSKKENLSNSDLMGMLAATIELLQSNSVPVLSANGKGLLADELTEGLWLFIPNWSIEKLQGGE